MQLAKLIVTEQIVNALLNKEIKPITVSAMKENELLSFKAQSAPAEEKFDQKPYKPK